MIIGITGYENEAYRGNARNAGFDYYLVKPVDTEQLRELIGQSAPLPQLTCGLPERWGAVMVDGRREKLVRDLDRQAHPLRPT